MFVIESGTLSIEDDKSIDLTKKYYSNALVEVVGDIDVTDAVKARSDGLHVVFSGKASSVRIDGKEKKRPLLFILIEKYKLGSILVLIGWLLITFVPWLTKEIRRVAGLKVDSGVSDERGV